MRMTATDIRQQQFAVRLFRGFDPQEVDAFLDGRQRDGVAAIAHADQHAIDDGKGEGQPQGHRRALARLAGHIDGAAQPVDRALDHIHAHATAG